VLAMVPAWWRHRRGAPRAAAAVGPPAASVTAAPSDFGPEHPPREGL